MSEVTTTTSVNTTTIGAWKRVHTYIALVSIMMAAFSVVGRSAATIFDAGSVKAIDEQRLSTIEKDVKELQEQSARKDVIEPQLSDLKKSVDDIRSSQNRTEDSLREILLRTRRGN